MTGVHLKRRGGRARPPRPRLIVAALVALVAFAVAVTSVSTAPAESTAESAKKGKKKGKKRKKKRGAQTSELQPVVFVGNNWDGTADVLTFRKPEEASARRCKRGKRGKRSAAEAAKRKRCKRGKRGKRSAAEAAKRKRCKAGKRGKRGKRSAAEAAKRKRRRCKAGRPATQGSFQRIARLNIVPDLNERMAEIFTGGDLQRLGFFLGIRLLVGEGNDQFVDDMYSTNDGRLLIVSRPSLRDVIGLDIATGKIVWRFVVAGQRSDHMAISPDGRHVAVSASTGNVVHILDTQTGQQVGQFPSGDSPHENTYTSDGRQIIHASIGLVYTPADQPQVDTTKGARYFQIVDANTNQVLERVDMGDKLEQAGYPNMSSAVRPMALSPDGQFVYLQVSFFHGFVEYDLATDQVRRVANLPNLVPNMPREEYLLDSAHHGIAMNKSGRQLCVAGTMSDYAAIVQRNNFKFELIKGGKKPYWSTSSADGEFCFVSWSGTDSVSAISYATGEEVAKIKVGYHPQRVRNGFVRRDWAQSKGG